MRGRPNRNKPHGHHHRNMTFESNGPEGKVRGNATQVYEKYLSLAREAVSSGNRVMAETFFQHAEHYYRVMAATMPRERLLQQQNGEGGFIHAQTSSEGGSAQSGDGGGAPQGEQHEQQAKSMDDNANDDGDDEPR